MANIAVYPLDAYGRNGVIFEDEAPRILSLTAAAGSAIEQYAASFDEQEPAPIAYELVVTP